MANAQLNAKLVFCSVPSSNTQASQTFYNTLLGGNDFARSLNSEFESYYRPISQDGLTLSITTRHDPREPITCFFAVDNLAQTVQQLEAAGGTVVVQPTAAPISGPPQAVSVFENALAAQQVQTSNSAGNFATMRDPDGNYIGLMQLETAMLHIFNAQPAQRVLSQGQVQQLEHWKQQGEALMPHP